MTAIAPTQSANWRRNSDSPLLWALVFLGSLALHGLAFWMLRPILLNFQVDTKSVPATVDLIEVAPVEFAEPDSTLATNTPPPTSTEAALPKSRGESASPNYSQGSQSAIPLSKAAEPDGATAIVPQSQPQGVQKPTVVRKSPLPRPSVTITPKPTVVRSPMLPSPKPTVVRSPMLPSPKPTVVRSPIPPSPKPTGERLPIPPSPKPTVVRSPILPSPKPTVVRSPIPPSPKPTPTETTTPTPEGQPIPQQNYPPPPTPPSTPDPLPPPPDRPLPTTPKESPPSTPEPLPPPPERPIGRSSSSTPPPSRDSQGVVATLDLKSIRTGERDIPEKLAQPRQSQKQLPSVSSPLLGASPIAGITLEVLLQIDDRGKLVAIIQVNAVDDGSGQGVNSGEYEALAKQLFQDWEFEPASSVGQPVYSELWLRVTVKPLSGG